MEAFIWLSDVAEKRNSDYRAAVQRMASQIGMSLTFADAAPAHNRSDWLSDQLGNCDFAFFDVTAASPDCLIALGMAIEDEAQWFALQDGDSPPTLGGTLVVPRTYFGAEDFARKARIIIEELQGASTVQHRQLMERIKQKVAQAGTLPLKGIAQELGERPSDIRPVVYAMVAGKVLTKVNDKRWARYALR
jgi:hypothetical protein